MWFKASWWSRYWLILFLTYLMIFLSFAAPSARSTSQKLAKNEKQPVLQFDFNSILPSIAGTLTETQVFGRQPWLTKQTFTIRLTFEQYFSAVETLQQLKTTFTPYEKLDVLLETFKEINQIGQDTCGSSHCWSMDDLFPVFQYVVVRARILQLGAEIHMIDDLMESHLSTGEYGIMFTTLQASYYQIIRESISMY